MDIDDLKVIFNNPDRCYYPGDTLTIHIEITSSSGFKLNAEAVELPPGQFICKFSFQVPRGVPPSFKGTTYENIGYIKYNIAVTIDRPWKFDETINEPFFIKSFFDLNRYPSLREPSGTIMEKNLSCCFTSGYISAVVRVPYKGYAIEQNIPITVQIENCSNLYIKDIYVKMRKITTFYTVDRADSTQNGEIVKAEQPLGVRINAGDTYAFCFNYVVPNVPVLNMMNCSIIDIKYALKFKLILSGLGCNMTGQLPIIVGSLPFDNAQSADEPPPYDLLELVA